MSEYEEWEEEWEYEERQPRSRWYDSRMNPIDNWRFLYWRPFVCKIRGCKITCYKVIGGEQPHYVYMCHRCVEMVDWAHPCGQCTNGCR